MKPVVINCCGCGFSLGIYVAALTHLYRNDGYCIKAHPVMAATITDAIKDHSWRLPVVPDKRNRLEEVEIIDLASTGVAVVRFEQLAIAAMAEQSEVYA